MVPRYKFVSLLVNHLNACLLPNRVDPSNSIRQKSLPSRITHNVVRSIIYKHSAEQSCCIRYNELHPMLPAQFRVFHHFCFRSITQNYNFEFRNLLFCQPLRASLNLRIFIQFRQFCYTCKCSVLPNVPLRQIELARQVRDNCCFRVMNFNYFHSGQNHILR